MNKKIKRKTFINHYFYKGYYKILFFWFPVTEWEADKNLVKEKLNIKGYY